ncbi:orotidine-5'-phosphate decarboxylase [Alloalcanivorax profundimaris]|uniref:orotidine-5'-phosphate decarboxylase n=1 Tax=Alloalcanivorax profundimaris TaxID=2735259 RepID=UPI00188900C6|nr:orotidine-5'-phosphate decarboxylase [Alloalcanivorax profundimaris]
MTADSPIIVALDYAEPEAALAMAGRLDPARVRVKVGKELFTRGGPAVVEALRERGFQVFLDLKFHDIPNTVAGAVRAAADLGVWMVNVHASGGGRMMDAAREALAGHAAPPRLIAVTVLTSQTDDDLREIGLRDGAEEQVRRLAALTRAHGLDGVVCSAREAAMLRELCGPDFDLVTPGIRPAGSAGDDQRRVVTPVQARGLGVSHMVIGRPITRAPNPTAVVDDILQSLS